MNVELKEIKEKKRGKAGQVWEIRKRVLGGKKAKNVATCIRNPNTGKLVVGKRDIMETTLKYCIETLANNKIEERFETEVNNKKEKVKLILDKKDGVFEAKQETFNQNIQK